jgi:hypothetical protein
MAKQINPGEPFHDGSPAPVPVSANGRPLTPGIRVVCSNRYGVYSGYVDRSYWRKQYQHYECRVSVKVEQSTMFSDVYPQDLRNIDSSKLNVSTRDVYVL